jgi:AcrR family transcriptional regulator
MEVLERSTRKQQIEEQATALFKTKGYTASSMRDLAQILGIEAASLYSHIKSKEEILQNICFKMADAFFLAIEQVDESSPEQQLSAAIKAHFKVISKNIDASAVFFNEWRHLSEPHLTEFLALRTRYEQYFMEIIHQGIKCGLFRPIDEKFAVMTLLSSINWTHQWYRPTGKMSMGEIGDQLSELLINGLIKNRNK